mmetsp:Transcript_16768/g.30794  ORF Transcript_16768/g.30794 Transcript_16768/m.30794 type:complete len:242 (-) Transcript_16768:747-1472(-)
MQTVEGKGASPGGASRGSGGSGAATRDRPGSAKGDGDCDDGRPRPADADRLDDDRRSGDDVRRSTERPREAGSARRSERDVRGAVDRERVSRKGKDREYSQEHTSDTTATIDVARHHDRGRDGEKMNQVLAGLRIVGEEEMTAIGIGSEVVDATALPGGRDHFLHHLFRRRRRLLLLLLLHLLRRHPRRLLLRRLLRHPPPLLLLLHLPAQTHYLLQGLLVKLPLKSRKRQGTARSLAHPL